MDMIMLSGDMKSRLLSIGCLCEEVNLLIGFKFFNNFSTTALGSEMQSAPSLRILGVYISLFALHSFHIQILSHQFEVTLLDCLQEFLVIDLLLAPPLGPTRVHSLSDRAFGLSLLLGKVSRGLVKDSRLGQPFHVPLVSDIVHFPALLVYNHKLPFLISHLTHVHFKAVIT